MKRRNVLVIMSDEHDPRHMGCSGSPIARTPNLDALAARGARFPHAYTPSPICVPARAAFATGLRVHQTRHWDNAMPYHGELEGWGHVLQRQGVRVESIGKLHYRAEEDPAGFDAEHLPMHVAGGHGMVWASIRDPFLLPGDPLRHQGKGKRMLGDRIGRGESSYTEYDAAITERTQEWLEQAARDPGQPFVLYVGLVAPHFPLLAPAAFYDLYEHVQWPQAKLHSAQGHTRHPWVQTYAQFEHNEENFHDADERRTAFAAYFGLVSWLDHNVGRILGTLERCGLADDTLVVYTSDHGDNLGARGLWGKSTLYQESVQVPMILAGPGVVSGVCQTPVDLLDLYPTLLQGAGVQAPDTPDPRPGRSLLELARSPADPERPIFSEYHAAGSNSAGFMLRKGRWKYHHYVGHPPELFDLQDDPEELRDLAGLPEHRQTLARMEAALRAICDPDAVDAQAKADQQRLIERHGGMQAAARLGAPGATPPPKAARAS